MKGSLISFDREREGERMVVRKKGVETSFQPFLVSESLPNREGVAV